MTFRYIEKLLDSGVHENQTLCLNFESKTDERVLTEQNWIHAVHALSAEKKYPFSFSEVSALVKTLPYETGALSEQELFTLYLQRGRFPFLYNYNFDDSGTQQYLSSLYDSIVLKDISQRHNIRDISLLKSLLQTRSKLYIADHGLRELLYLQVCYLLADDTTIQREFGVLESIHDNFPKYVLSMDTVDRSRNGITNMNIADWLLGK